MKKDITNTQVKRVVLGILCYICVGLEASILVYYIGEEYRGIVSLYLIVLAVILGIYNYVDKKLVKEK